MTTTFGHRYAAQSTTPTGSATRTVPASLALLGILTILISAWAPSLLTWAPALGIAPTASSWTWSL